MTPGVAPVAQKPRPVAYYLQEPLKKRIDECIREEIFEKCQCGVEDLEFYGCKFTKDGLKPAPDKVKAVKDKAKAIGSVAEAGKSISDAVTKSDELKELQLITELRNRKLEEKKGKGFKVIG
ncbi:hypothetical protein LOTGIDRAFT_160973 [Lottia gigantea]|uniref:Uncharacterized protein n=1 Tax=Lottia gigantea TaxID=225164 RepID=V4BZZ4_LOTGI|nr:hypothetical protein LOTGIDRAFT_160973 [Lottia gigantea]ESO94739.1 hypothetical protein LOTGIDRAFT_160973 [Lottia gigantea]